MKKYKDKWTQRKLEYDSSEFAVQRTKVKAELKVFDFKSMQSTHILNDLKMAADRFRSINIQRSQNIIIGFAKLMVDSVKKQNVIDSLLKSIEENKYKYKVLSEKLKMKLINDENRTSSKEDKEPHCILPVKLKFDEHNLSDQQGVTLFFCISIKLCIYVILIIMSVLCMWIALKHWYTFGSLINTLLDDIIQRSK